MSKINANNIFYVNVDDTHFGLAEKFEIAEEHGFHMLADGYEGFDMDELLSNIELVITAGSAEDTIIILDTLKKYTA